MITARTGDMFTKRWYFQIESTNAVFVFLFQRFCFFQLLLEYLIKTGTEKVAQQCKENIYAIQTLKDFQYLEEGKDQGTHVREKAKQLVSLLKDDERLKNERARALKAKERFARTASGFGSDGSIDGPSAREVMHW
jgi:epsin